MAIKRSRGFDLGPIGFLVITNIILYIFTSISQGLFDLLALVPASFLQRPWTILTSMFLHDRFPGYWHIIGNMITLYFFGSYLIRLVGEKKFLVVYFIGGIVGNLFFLLYAYLFGGLSVNVPYMLHVSLFSKVVGASGAIFALAGALTVMSPKSKVFIIPIPVPVPLWVAVIGGFLILSFLPGVAWQAHLGGLVFGVVMGYFFRRRQHRFYR